MAIITLTSDMGIRDYYVASVKGAVLRELADATIVDISHHITPFNNAEAAFVLRNCYRDFPEGTVHVIAVNPEEVINPEDPDEDIVHCAAKYDGHYFVAADNGIFGLLFDRNPDELVQLTLASDSDDLTFPARHIFVKAACHIARGGTLSVIGKQKDSFRRALVLRATSDADTIKGVVMHIDGYGNIITNITEQLFREVARGREFVINARQESYFEVTRISQRYSDVEQGDMVALFGASGYLQIAMNRGVEGFGGGAARLLGMHVNDRVIVSFETAPTGLQEL